MVLEGSLSCGLDRLEQRCELCWKREFIAVFQTLQDTVSMSIRMTKEVRKNE